MIFYWIYRESHSDEAEETEVDFNLAMFRLLAQQNDIMTDHTTILAEINNNLAAIAEALQNKNKQWTDINNLPKTFQLPKFIPLYHS